MPYPNQLLLLGGRPDLPTLDMRWDSGVMVAKAFGGMVPSFSRASSDYVQNAAGILVPVASGVQAVEYSAALGWAWRGQEQRTNSIVRSADFSTSWGTAGATITPNATTAPDGSGRGALVTSTNTAVNQGMATQNVPMQSNTVYTVSVYAKQGSHGAFIQMAGNIESVQSGCSYGFDLATQTIGSPSVYGRAQMVGSPFLIPIGGGWFRVGFSFQYTAASSVSGTCAMWIRPNHIANAATPTTVYLAFPQDEVGGLSSPILTDASALVRQADSLSISTAGWFNPAAGSFMVECGIYPGSLQGNGARDLFNLGSANDRLLLRGMQPSPGVTYPQWIVGNGVALNAVAAGGTALGTFEKLAVSYASDRNGAFYRNGGGNGISNYSGSAQSSMTLGPFFNGYIRRIRYWPRLMSAAELAALTS